MSVIGIFRQVRCLTSAAAAVQSAKNMTSLRREPTNPHSTRRYWVAFSLVALIHCGLTFIFTLWSMAWQMVVLDTGGTLAPLGLKIVSTIDLLLALPVLLPLARLALHLGFADPVHDPIYWPLPVINSLLVAYSVTATIRWCAARRQTSKQQSPS
jgi:hypothetical protein